MSYVRRCRKARPVTWDAARLCRQPLRWGSLAHSLKQRRQESGSFHGTLLKPSRNTKACCIPVFNGLLLRGMVITLCMNTVLPNTWRLITQMLNCVSKPPLKVLIDLNMRVISIRIITLLTASRLYEIKNVVSTHNVNTVTIKDKVCFNFNVHLFSPNLEEVLSTFLILFPVLILPIRQKLLPTLMMYKLIHSSTKLDIILQRGEVMGHWAMKVLIWDSVIKK